MTPGLTCTGDCLISECCGELGRDPCHHPVRVLALAECVQGFDCSADRSAVSVARQSRGQVVHRVVWDDFAASDRGIHLDSANIDGTNLRSVYDQPRGFTMYLTMDPSGTHVAFSTCCRDEFPALVVVPVLGGKALKPLAHHRDIYFVGGIGWSPDGKRLAFEGSTRSDQKTPLWTVKPDGTQLRHVLTLRNRYINPELAWTPKGILYSDGRDMRRAAGGSSHVVMSHVWSLRMSGDGQHILTNRIKDGKRSVWYSATDGTAQGAPVRDEQGTRRQLLGTLSELRRYAGARTPRDSPRTWQTGCL